MPVLNLNSRINGVGTVLPFPKSDFTQAQVERWRDRNLRFGEITAWKNPQTGETVKIGWKLQETPRSWQLALVKL